MSSNRLVKMIEFRIKETTVNQQIINNIKNQIVKFYNSKVIVIFA